MAGESNADVYASLGVNSAVLTSGNISEHEQNMLALDVAARDGDDSIHIFEDEPEVREDDPYAIGDKFATEKDENRMQVRINADGESSVDGEVVDQADESTEGDDEFTPLGETPDSLVDAVNALSTSEEGFQEVMQKAVDNGLTQEAITQINAEYLEGEGLSDASYAALDAAGYSRNFVDTYIAGQEAGITKYVNEVWAYAGGQERFQALHAHLEASNPEAASALENAMNSGDIGTLKAIINLAGESRAKKFGKPQARSVTTRSTPAPQVKQEVGFESQAEMIKAMSDVRYRTDDKYRREVEQKVLRTNF